MPVEWVEFSGKHNGKNHTNELYWVTAAEINNDHFEVMRSIDGKNFEVIGTVKAAGNSHQMSYYNMVDNQLIDGEFTYYYQLRQIDFDGSSSLSDVITIRLDQQINRNVEMYPNPANELVNIRIDGKAGDQVKAHLMDNTGKLVTTMVNTLLSQNSEMFRFDVTALPSGVYMVNISVGNKLFTQKLIIIE